MKFIIGPEIVTNRHIFLSLPCYGSEGNVVCSTWKFGGFTTLDSSRLECNSMRHF